MTVSYTNQVSDCKGFGNFWRLLFRWRGSVYKLVWTDLLTYIIIYSILSVVYRVVLHEDQKRVFEKVSLSCEYFSDFIPISFVLGFYVSLVIKRWWDQYLTLPWPDSIALYVSTSIHGHDTQGRLMRRTILRYVNLSILLTLIMVTPRAKKRFPTLDHIVEAGFMTANEKKIFTIMRQKTSHPMYYVPLVWAGTLVARARKEVRILDDFAMKTIIDELNNLRVKLNGMLGFDWISVPLVYTQVVTLAVYTFFLSTIMGRQFLDPKQNYPKNDIDFYFPFFTMLQFFFYMGWLKVAEALINPFGEDDDDFEVNWLIDRNIQVSYLIVDEMHTEYPELTQDLYYNEVYPHELPYTAATEQYKRDPPLGSTAGILVPEAKQEFLPLVEEAQGVECTDDIEGGAGPGARGKNSRCSFSSSVSANKNSFVSMLQNRLRRGDNQSSTGTNTDSQTSLGRKKRRRSASQCESEGSVASAPMIRDNTSRTSLKKKNRKRSVSQSESHLSDTSVTSSAVITTTTNTKLPESTNADREGIFYLSSSPVLPRIRVTKPPPTPTPPSTTTTSLSSLPSSSRDTSDPILLKVSHLQTDVDVSDKGGATTSQPKRGSRPAKEHSSSAASSSSQTYEGGRRGKDREDSRFPVLSPTLEDQEEPNSSDADKTLGTPRTQDTKTTMLETPAVEISPTQESTTGDDKNSVVEEWYQETWQV